MINQTQAWKNLVVHQKKLANNSLQFLFAKDSERPAKFWFEAPNLTLDLSKNHLTQKTLPLLIELAKTANLESFREALLTGKKINNTEGRAALHTALRNQSKQSIYVDDDDVMPQIHASLTKMQTFCEQVHNQTWLGFSGKPITNVVNLGIGGSYLGPKLVVEALPTYQKQSINCHFVANVDPIAIESILKTLNPETTLFIVSSKSFTTSETLTNAKRAKNWLLSGTDHPEALSKHFIGITAIPEKAENFGIPQANIFKFWDWVGGRFSLWSAIGLPIALTLGFEQFAELLQGAYQMDEHFKQADFINNLPVLLALIGIWYRNFFNTSTHAIIPYSQSLERLPSYLQQLEMESNGKRVTREGKPVTYNTAPIIWGGSGTTDQHAFHQFLHQGTELTPVDFIVARQSNTDNQPQHDQLVANCFAQAEALLTGQTLQEAYRIMPGNRPSTVILMDQLTPRTLGSLIALYEHKVFVQGVIWNINSFDQWGVELGKQLAKTLIPAVSGNSSLPENSINKQLVDWYCKK